jgi:uracil-DNA glycosylase family 4
MSCPMCPGKNKCVSASGPVTSPYLFLGEAPGVDEDWKGIPFIGKTGREVNEGYLPLAGLRRDDLRFTNAILCLPDTPKHKLELKKQAHKDLLQVVR